VLTDTGDATDLTVLCGRQAFRRLSDVNIII